MNVFILFNISYVFMEKSKSQRSIPDLGYLGSDNYPIRVE